MNKTSEYSYNDYPTQARQSTLTTPGTVSASFLAFMVAAAAGVIGAFLLFRDKSDLINALRKSGQEHGTTLTETQIAQSVTVGLWVAVAVAVVLGTLYLRFASKLKTGRNWARILLAFLTVVQLGSLVIINSTSPVTFISAAAAALGVLMSFMPASNSYFAAAKPTR
jgi:MFS family permease